jgi:GntR family transcriptional repressor for pyruvate dehydrogenase complex
LNRSSRARFRQPRVAEMVAAELRERIVSGALEDGAVLPKQEQLLEEYQVSPPSIREALGILETEGLITVMRGKVGGAVVHRPQPEKVTYMLALVLQSRNVTLRDVTGGLGQLERACAEACANREDREETVLPRLRATLDAANAAIEDAHEYTALARRFHSDMTATCGNESMALVVGALEALWSAHVDSLARYPAQYGSFVDIDVRRKLAKEHERIYRCIAKGDGSGAARALRDHMTPGRADELRHQFDVDETVEATFVRAI